MPLVGSTAITKADCLVVMFSGSGAVAKWTKAADCKSAIPGSNPGGASHGSRFVAVTSVFSCADGDAGKCEVLPEVLPEMALYRCVAVFSAL